MAAPRRENRGRNAAEGNRAALIAAAREVFGEQGLDAPLSAVARRAGVGQGSLYRHFPDRVGLAVAAFEDNVVQLERLAGTPGATLRQLLDLLTEQTVESVAFVDLVRASDDGRLVAVTERVEAALAGPLRVARRDGTVRASLRMPDLMLALAMLAGAVSSVPPGERRRTAGACWRLLDRGLTDRG